MTTEITGPLYEYLMSLRTLDSDLTNMIYNLDTVPLEMLIAGVPSTSTSLEVWGNGDFWITVFAPTDFTRLADREYTDKTSRNQYFRGANAAGGRSWDERFYTTLADIKKSFSRAIKLATEEI